jgi:hypothetical protein
MIGMVRPPKYRIRFSKNGFKTIEIKFNGEKAKERRNDSLFIKLEEN